MFKLYTFESVKEMISNMGRFVMFRQTTPPPPRPPPPKKNKKKKKKKNKQTQTSLRIGSLEK